MGNCTMSNDVILEEKDFYKSFSAQLHLERRRTVQQFEQCFPYHFHSIFKNV